MYIGCIKRNVVLIAVVAALTAGVSTAVAQESGKQPLLKDATPEELQQIIRSYEGEKAVLVNVWATWCGPCKEEFPDIVKLQHEYSEELQVIFISTDFDDSRGKVKDFLKDHNVNWTTYFQQGNDQQFIESLSSEWTGAMPFTKIISRDGTVVAQWENSADYDTFNKHVNKAIGS
ncbi:MAG: redoxin family protein [Balneolaceae bacterium]|nr:redoxin family protein [Balneolaceae bacterium]